MNKEQKRLWKREQKELKRLAKENSGKPLKHPAAESAFVFGNGITRKEMDPETLRGKGTIYGCNFFYEDCVPDVLIAVDMAIANHIQKSGYTKDNLMYTRNPVKWFGKETKVQEIKKNNAYSSGPVACTLACEAGHRYIYMIGFDLMGLGKFDDKKEKRKLNNLFADREFYKKSNADETHYNNWIMQMTDIMKEFHDRKFIRVNPHLDYSPLEWRDLHNYKSIHLKHFLQQINT